MTLAVEAVFENGVLKPITPLALAENQKVHIIVQTDTAQNSEPTPWHWHEARKIDDGFEGTVADELIRQRREG